jgi:hypothetical protein
MIIYCDNKDCEDHNEECVEHCNGEGIRSQGHLCYDAIIKYKEEDYQI